MLQELIKETMETKATEILAVGDFNEDRSTKKLKISLLKWCYVMCLVKIMKLSKIIEMETLSVEQSTKIVSQDHKKLIE